MFMKNTAAEKSLSWTIRFEYKNIKKAERLIFRSAFLITYSLRFQALSDGGF